MNSFLATNKQMSVSHEGQISINDFNSRTLNGIQGYKKVLKGAEVS